MKIDLDELEALLPELVPEEYIEYVEASDRSVLRKRGFDPKTLCILNLELRENDETGWTRNRFFLSGDGFGNYYFVSTEPERSDRVRLWSHDPPGIEDAQEDLESFLDSAQQENPARGPLPPKSFCIARSAAWAESILRPISLDEWKVAVSACKGVQYRGYRSGQDPFTGKELRFDMPGFATAEVGGGTLNLRLWCGRVIGDYVAEARPLLTSLAHALGAKLTVRAGG
ncbi:SMI1/KNR4 family protein [Steroidobacter flavus]|uniref:SMI1/KNR4 family protein n=1 Tax=Steroidobacter flavus TaxID=1842136 RepID=A0ABV8SP56_9GAMM